MWSNGCSADTDCELGTFCYKQQYWSQCKEIKEIPNEDCIRTFNNGQEEGEAYGCGVDKNCCNPAATCGADKLCHLPCTVGNDSMNGLPILMC